MDLLSSLQAASLQAPDSDIDMPDATDGGVNGETTEQYSMLEILPTLAQRYIFGYLTKEDHLNLRIVSAGLKRTVEVLSLFRPNVTLSNHLLDQLIERLSRVAERRVGVLFVEYYTGELPIKSVDEDNGEIMEEFLTPDTKVDGLDVGYGNKPEINIELLRDFGACLVSLVLNSGCLSTTDTATLSGHTFPKLKSLSFNVRLSTLKHDLGTGDCQSTPVLSSHMVNLCGFLSSSTFPYLKKLSVTMWLAHSDKYWASDPFHGASWNRTYPAIFGDASLFIPTFKNFLLAHKTVIREFHLAHNSHEILPCLEEMAQLQLKDLTLNIFPSHLQNIISYSSQSLTTLRLLNKDTEVDTFVEFAIDWLNSTTLRQLKSLELTLFFGIMPIPLQTVLPVGANRKLEFLDNLKINLVFHEERLYSAPTPARARRERDWHNWQRNVIQVLTFVAPNIKELEFSTAEDIVFPVTYASDLLRSLTLLQRFSFVVENEPTDVENSCAYDALIALHNWANATTGLHGMLVRKSESKRFAFGRMKIMVYCLEIKIVDREQFNAFNSTSPSSPIPGSHLENGETTIASNNTSGQIGSSDVQEADLNSQQPGPSRYLLQRIRFD